MGNPLQYSCLENPYGQRRLAGYRPWGRKKLNTAERLSTAHNLHRIGIDYNTCIRFELIMRKRSFG